MDDIQRSDAPRLDVRDLRVVLAVAKAGSTARAASIVHLTQPAVSRALLAAEEKLGTLLFERRGRGLRLTDAGQQLVRGAERLLLELRDLEHRVRKPAASSRVRLVCECYTAYHWLPSVLVSLRAELPQFDIVLAIEHTASPVAALEAGEIDVALLTTGTLDAASALRERPLFSDEIVFLVSTSHVLATRKAITREDLKSHPLVTSPVPAAEAQAFIRSVFGRARPKLRLHRLPLTEAILDVTRAGLGIAVMSEWIASPHLGKGDLVAKRLSSGAIERPWRIAWCKSAEPAAQRLGAGGHRSQHPLRVTRGCSEDTDNTR